MKTHLYMLKLPGMCLLLILVAGNLLGVLQTVNAQNMHVQDIRGQLLDQFTEEAVAGAVVKVETASTKLEAVTDEEGFFRLENVPTGRFKLRAQVSGFETLVLSDLVLNEGKQLVLNLKLVPVMATLDAQVISVPAMKAISARSISVEETKRYAAVFFDPARVAATMPGVVQADDQSNNLIVRGNSPNGVLWRLEGLDIVNPNHLSNAGTLGDRATAGGGGANILSTQLLGNSTFSTSAFTSEYGNALSGVFDIGLRTGNDERNEFTAQVGLIGIDLSAEGPINKLNKSSFLVNYRYSTVGLLSLMGVPLGDEDIRYQDLAFNLNFPTEKAGTFTLFGMGGLSSNQFFGDQRDSLSFPGSGVWKEYFDIGFRSNMGAAGITHKIRVGDRGLIRSALAYSARYTDRTVRFAPANALREADTLQEGRMSASTALNYSLSQALQLKAGLQVSILDFFLRSYRISGVRPAPVGYGTYSQSILQPYTQLVWQPLKNLSLKGGLHAIYNLNNEHYGGRVLEPRMRASYTFGRQAVHAGVSWHSQRQLPGTYLSVGIDPADPFGFAYLNRNLGLTRARHFVLNYDYYANAFLRFRVEGYYQQMYDVPIVDLPGRTFSALNLLEGYVVDQLENVGVGRNYGLELNVERILQRHVYYLLSGSLYRSLYTGGDGVERSSRFDGRFSLAGTVGYEWERESKKRKQQIFGLNLRSVFRGGMREMPIDIAGSRNEFTTLFDESEGFSQQLPNYFRLDFRFTFKRNRPGYTSTLGVDIQNLLNTRNVANRYYDRAYDRVFIRYQLGIIPLLSYRMEF